MEEVYMKMIFFVSLFLGIGIGIGITLIIKLMKESIKAKYEFLSTLSKDQLKKFSEYMIKR